MFLCPGQKVIDLEKWLTSPLVCPRIRMRHACAPRSLALSYSGKFIWGWVPENLRNYDTSTLYKVDCTRTRTSNH